MDLRALRAFVTLATKRTMRETSQYLARPEAEIAAQIKQLEAKHGTLFEIEGGEWSLNENGWSVYYKAIDLMAKSQEQPQTPLQQERPPPTADARPTVGSPRQGDGRPALTRRPTTPPAPPRPQGRPIVGQPDLDSAPSVTARYVGPSQDGGNSLPSGLKVKSRSGEQTRARGLKIVRPTERLGVGMIPTVCPYLAPRLVRDLRSQRPQTEVTIYEDTIDGLLKLNSEGLIEIAIGATPFVDASVETYRFYHEHLMVVVSREHPLANEEAIAVEDLQAHRIITPGAGTPLADDVLRYFQDHGVEPSVVARTSHLVTVFELVGANHGIAILPALACITDSATDLVAIPLVPSPQVRTLLLFWTVGGILPPAGLWLVNWLTERVKTWPGDPSQRAH